MYRRRAVDVDHERAAGGRDPVGQRGFLAQHRLQFHHIFPKSLLKGRYEKKEINEIANMAFVSGKTNRKISNTRHCHQFISIPPHTLRDCPVI